MKNHLLFAFLFLAMLAGAPLHAENPPAQAEENDPLKGIVIHPRPEDFATAQQLALQNRDERLAMLHKSIECVQKATNVEDLSNCQKEERKSLDIIWLSYCDTMVSFLPGMAVRNRAIPQRATECERAHSAVTGKPMAPRPLIEQPQDGAEE